MERHPGILAVNQTAGPTPVLWARLAEFLPLEKTRRRVRALTGNRIDR